MFGPTRVLMWTIQRNSQRTTEQFRETCVVLFCAYMRSRPELKAAQRWACMDCHLFGLVSDPLSLARSFLNIQTNTQAQCQFELQQNFQKWEFCHHLLTLKITCWSLLTIKGNTDVDGFVKDSLFWIQSVQWTFSLHQHFWGLKWFIHESDWFGSQVHHIDSTL